MAASMKSKFQGSLVGAVVGDCIGAVFEGGWYDGVKISKILKVIRQIEKSSTPDSSPDKAKQKKLKVEKNVYHFTDDTAMARSVAKSLIQHNQFSATDLAQRFAEEYFREPGRGYGGSISTVFHGLREANYEDVYRPAARQFDGQGSYGNGGAMRIAPAALFACSKKYDFPKLAELTEQITRLTHSHRQAIQGSILQCYMVNQCLQSNTTVNVDQLIDSLIDTMKTLEVNEQNTTSTETSCERMDEGTNSSDSRETREATASDENDSGETTPKTYWHKLELVREFVKRDTQPSVEEVTKQLGVYIAALDSVPAAVYCFLRALKDIDGLEGRNGFERTILYSISHGGDTDTVATMAGAIAGAYYGLEMIPVSWQLCCEGVEEANRDAELLYTLSKTDGSNTDDGQFEETHL